jgi:hypothetical protein
VIGGYNLYAQRLINTYLFDCDSDSVFTTTGHCDTIPLFHSTNEPAELEDKAAVHHSGSATLLSLVRLCAILTGPHDVAAPESQGTDSAKRG